jgi:regulator of sirC expression with transglutaminase-like and TPR domain
VNGNLRSELARVVADGPNADLATGALVIARIAYPHLEPERSLARLDALASEVAPAAARTRPPADRTRALARRLNELGYRGNRDDYYDPRNSFLNDVLDRRLGIPISLGVLAIEVGRRLDVPLAGIGFPGHFLLRGATEEAPLFLDPFHGGIEVDEVGLLARLRALARQAGRQAPDFATVPAELLEPTPAPAILARMLRNLVHIYLQRADDARALAAVDLLLVTSPDAPDELRTRGMLYERVGCPAAAVTDFRRYLELVPTAPDAASIELRAARLADDAPTLH